MIVIRLFYILVVTIEHTMQVYVRERDSIYKRMIDIEQIKQRKWEDDIIIGTHVLSNVFMAFFISFLFLWIRGSFPRLRYDLFMMIAWKGILFMVLGFLIYGFVICIIY